MKLGVLCSGNLGLKILMQLTQYYSISFVFTDSKSNDIVEYCIKSKLPIFVGNPRIKSYKDFLFNKTCEILLSVNYIFLIEEDLIKFPNKYSINIHGSLLPKYRGRSPHIWAIINNEKKTGISAHLIDSGCDTGDILEQIEIEICDDDTGAMLLQKFHENYLPIIKKVIEKIDNNQILCKKQDHSKSTFFGKRTPEDGLIDWNWQKERIFNWVRAQAFPYPGAFTYLEGIKLTIDAISFVDDGYNYSMQNGTILSFNPLKVKTSNGVILISSHRESLNHFINTKKIVFG